MLPHAAAVGPLLRRPHLAAPGSTAAPSPAAAAQQLPIPRCSQGQAQGQLARDVRAVPLRVVLVGKGNSAGASLMAAEWLDKVRRYTSVQEVQVKPNPKKSSSVQVQKQAEGEKVLKALDSRDWVVLLDERGRDLKSEDMARIIAAAGDKGTPLVFCIGGPFGHSDEVRARSNESIRLSSMVLNHQVAHVVLLEQLYRGWTILRGEPYHH